jgi:hypothetical protein
MVGLFLFFLTNFFNLKFLYFLLIFLFGSCNTSSNAPILDFDQWNRVNNVAITQIKSGDIILRKGRDELSNIFAQVNSKNQNYSHCGIAQFTPSGLYVYHIIGSHDNPKGRIIRESIRSYVNPKLIANWAVIHYNLDSLKMSLLFEKVQYYLSQKVSFDHRFDLESDGQLYCSEFIYKALIYATKDTALISKSISSFGKPYIAIDNLFGHRGSKTVCEITYK